MAEVVYTPAQKKVIETRDANILVAAAAGSGKTEVLSKRIISLIMDDKNPIDIDRMLILTFTSAAASEMRERIGRELAKALEKDPDNERLYRQSTLLQAAQISTIDSFCLFVIRNNFSDIELDPGFRIMDEGEGKLMFQDALDEVLGNHFNNPDELFLRLVECYGTALNENKLEEIIRNLHKFVMSNPEPEKWMEEAKSSYAVNDTEAINSLPIWENTETIRDSIVKEGLRISKLAFDIVYGEGGPKSKCADTVNDYYNFFKSFNETKDYEKRCDLINKSEFAPFKRNKLKEGEDEDKKDTVYSLRDQAQECIQKLKKYYLISPDQIVYDSKFVYDSIDALMLLLKEVEEAFAKKKREENVLDFSDMEHLALRILVDHYEDGKVIPSSTAKEYRDFYDCIMVDEYQDSNYVQEYILSAIKREDNYFMVGDVKQSIYKFRHACPDIFMDKYDSFGDEAPDIKIDLNKNFRSRPEILDYCNMVFQTVMTRGTSGIDYDERAALSFGLSEVYKERNDCNTEILVLDNKESEANDLIETKKHQAEALMVAGKIKELINGNFVVYDKEAKINRNVRYSDIVILFRATRDFDQSFKKVLESQGIPVYTNIKTGYFATEEVRGLLNYLKVLDNPRQDIPLYGVMTSVIGRFKPEEIASIKAVTNKNSLYECIISYEEGDLKNRLDDFLRKLTKHRDMTGYMRIRELLEAILEDTGYLDYYTAFPDGDRRSENIRALLEKAVSFQQTSYSGLFRFVRYVDLLKEKEVDYGESSLVSESDNVVKIMTIHSSKGLEYPVCFLSGIGKNYNLMDASGMVLFDMNYGIGMDYINPKDRQRRKTMQSMLLSEVIKRSDKQEEIRVLYVALTRAREKLIITGEVSKASERIEKLKNLSGDLGILEASSYFDLIALAHIRNHREDEIKIKSFDDLYMDKIDKEYHKATLYGDLVTHRYETDESVADYIKERTNFEYSFKYLEGLHVKTTVSELKHKRIEEQEPSANLFPENNDTAYIPSFIEEKEKRKGTLIGSAFHRFMELLEFKGLDILYDGDILDKDNALKYIEKVKDEEVRLGRLSSEFATLINNKKVLAFLDSNLAKRMILADKFGKLYKEQSFFYGIPANRVRKEYPECEKMLMQGVIDVYFEEDGKLIIADYKTDRVDTKDELIVRYGIQLELYKEALSSLTGKEVSELILYSTRQEQEIAINSAFLT